MVACGCTPPLNLAYGFATNVGRHQVHWLVKPLYSSDVVAHFCGDIEAFAAAFLQGGISFLRTARKAIETCSANRQEPFLFQRYNKAMRSEPVVK